MLLQECIHIGLKELWGNKVRSCLSVVGIVIGIISLLVMMAIMSGIEKKWLDYIEESGGLTKATIRSKTPTVDGEAREDLKRDLTMEDVAIVQSQKELVRFVSPEINDYHVVSHEGRNRFYAEVTGGTRGMLPIYKQSLGVGRPLTAEDVKYARSVCVIGTKVRDELFGSRINPVGKTITIGGLLFKVVGMLEENVSLRRKKNILEWKNEVIFVPITVYPKKLDKEAKIQAIHYIARGKKDIGKAKKEVGRMINYHHRMAGDTEIKTMEESYQESKKSLRTMKFGFTFIAGISLLVGGIGIMNIMIASITQRVREIGIRKAVGATSKDILTQFLLESVIVSAVGGLLGVLGAFAAVGVVSLVSEESKPVIGLGAVVFSSCFALIIGVTFGAYPALKASKLDPIKALRYQ